MDDYDSPWKEAIEDWFEPFLAFFFAAVHSEIDWARGYEFLDTEMQQLASDSEQGRRTVDKLVKVHWRTGEELWILIHIEVQSQAETAFPERMYSYHYRIWDKFHRPVVSLAVLADEVESWRPKEYHYERCGCELIFRFPTVKLLDFADRETWLEEHENPFALIALAHLKTMQTRNNDAVRMVWKIRLVKRMYDRGFSAEKVRQLFKVLDWLLRLPKEIEKIVWKEIEKIERENAMPYVTSVERIGIERGLEMGLARGHEDGMKKGIEKGIERGRVEGRQEGILLAGIKALLEAKFGADGLRAFPEIETVESIEKLRSILDGIQKTQSVEEARKLWS